MNFKNAWKCKKCPKDGGEGGCPMWWEILLQHDVTGAQKIKKQCGFTIMPELFNVVCSDTMHATTAAYDMRNKVIQNTGRVIRVINDKMNLGFEEEELIEMEDPEPKQIEENTE